MSIKKMAWDLPDFGRIIDIAMELSLTFKILYLSKRKNSSQLNCWVRFMKCFHDNEYPLFNRSYYPTKPHKMTTTTPRPPSSTDNAKILHNISLAAVILCPALILLPPRKLDFYTFTLLSGTFLGSNQLAQDYTGRSFVTRINGIVERRRIEGLKKREKRKEYRRETTEWEREGLVGRLSMDAEGEQTGGVLEEVKRQDEARSGKWKEDRDKREKEATEEGKGYGDLIMDQVWEVWNWRKGKSDADEDEKSAEERKDGNGEGKR
jgi:hypothetical protein